MRPIATYIQRMLQMIDKLERYTLGMNYEDFADDEKTIDACITPIIQLWEQANNIKKYYYADQINKQREIIDTRNFLVHIYHKVDKDIIWDIITVHIPQLKKELQLKMNDLSHLN